MSIMDLGLLKIQLISLLVEILRKKSKQNTVLLLREVNLQVYHLQR